MHSLRHSFASMPIMDAAAITEVQHLLAHSSPAVTLRVRHNLDTYWILRSLRRPPRADKCLISLSGEVAEWSKAPDC